MAVRVNQREIVEVPFIMPNGTVLPHPALVISKRELQEIENGMFYALLISTKQIHSKYAIRIEPEWLNKPMSRQSYFVTHLLNSFSTRDVMKQNNTFVKVEFFDRIIDRVIENIIGA